MSTKKTTTTNSSNTLNFDPQSMGLYHSLNKSGSDTMQDFMQDPFKSSFFLQQMGMGNQFTQAMGERNMGNILNNAIAGGWGGANLPGFIQSQVARTGRGTSAMQANMLNNQLINAGNLRFQAGAQGLNYKPLITGEKGNSTSTQTQSGLGTWLPQVIGAAASIGLAPFTGGASLAGLGGLSKMGGGGGGAMAGTSDNFWNNSAWANVDSAQNAPTYGGNAGFVGNPFGPG